MAEEYDYPEDEFDRLAKERKVLGAHREVRSKRPWWLAALAIVVIVPLLAWIVVRAGAVDTVTNVATPSATATPTQTENPEPDDKKTTNSTPDDTKDTVDTSLEISVLNGSGINGLAASKAEALNGEGFTNTIADNYSGGATPAESTVYYANEDEAATAKKIGSILGISKVELEPEYVSGGQGIVVVLRSDAA